MTGRTHVMCTLGAAALCSLEISSNVGRAGFIIASAVSSLLPDVDIHQSRAGKKLPIISKFLKHRGITHTLLFPLILFILYKQMHTPVVYAFTGLIVSILLVLLFRTANILLVPLLALLCYALPELGEYFLLGLTFGWCMHIFQDMFNAKGCPILFPLTSDHFSIMSIKTRHWTEYVFLILWFGGLGLWGFLKVVGE